SIFSTHPLTAERIAYLSALPRNHPDGGVDKAAYRALIRPFLRHWLDQEISQRDPGASLQLFDRLAAPGTDLGVLNYARGEVYRYRDGDGDVQHALASYTEATQHEDAPVETWRQIGVVQTKAHDNAAAIAAFQHYLDAAPNASDRELITMTINNL